MLKLKILQNSVSILKHLNLQRVQDKPFYSYLSFCNSYKKLIYYFLSVLIFFERFQVFFWMQLDFFNEIRFICDRQNLNDHAIYLLSLRKQVEESIYTGNQVIPIWCEFSKNWLCNYKELSVFFHEESKKVIKYRDISKKNEKICHIVLST